MTKEDQILEALEQVKQSQNDLARHLSEQIGKITGTQAVIVERLNQLIGAYNEDAKTFLLKNYAASNEIN